VRQDLHLLGPGRDSGWGGRREVNNPKPLAAGIAPPNPWPVSVTYDHMTIMNCFLNWEQGTNQQKGLHWLQGICKHVAE
jgi:hypothetical protein